MSLLGIVLTKRGEKCTIGAFQGVRKGAFGESICGLRAYLRGESSMSREFGPRRVLPVKEALRELGTLLPRGGDLWFLDTDTPSRISLKGGSGEPLWVSTKYQQLEVASLDGYGLCMILDGRVQLAQSDEWIYHELLVHPACVLHGNPKSALVLGGGDGCAARELLRYPGLERVCVVDIDEEVVALFRDRLSFLNGGALGDRRVRILTGDAMEFLADTGEQYDLIVSDLTEPFDPEQEDMELSTPLYRPEAYDMVLRRLSADGVFVCQTGGILHQPHYDRFHLEILEGIRKAFPHVITAYEFVPSFEALWSITLASPRPLHASPQEVDRRLAALGVSGLRYYDGLAHQRAFSSPKFARDTNG